MNKSNSICFFFTFSASLQLSLSRTIFQIYFVHSKWRSQLEICCLPLCCTCGWGRRLHQNLRKTLQYSTKRSTRSEFKFRSWNFVFKQSMPPGGRQWRQTSIFEVHRNDHQRDRVSSSAPSFLDKRLTGFAGVFRPATFAATCATCSEFQEFENTFFLPLSTSACKIQEIYQDSYPWGFFLNHGSRGNLDRYELQKNDTHSGRNSAKREEFVWCGRELQDHNGFRNNCEGRVIPMFEHRKQWFRQPD